MDLTTMIIPKGREEYKCYDLIKYFITYNEKFRKVIEEGLITENIFPFDEELLEKFNSINIRIPGVKNIDEIFFKGYNIGGCTTMAYQLSFLFKECYKCAGILPILAGTRNSIDGTHTWLESYDGWIYDTSLMLVIKKEYAKNIGYIENVREEYKDLQFYDVQKEYALDKNLKVKSKK